MEPTSVRYVAIPIVLWFVKRFRKAERTELASDRTARREEAWYPAWYRRGSAVFTQANAIRVDRLTIGRPANPLLW
jgi:hypothetical protein